VYIGCIVSIEYCSRDRCSHIRAQLPSVILIGGGCGHLYLGRVPFT
jgi:hypothetical protein